MNAVVPARPVLLQVRMAVQANLLPGLVLWCGLALLLVAYAWSPAVQAGLAQWGATKQAWGYSFSFLSYATFAVLVPEALSLLFLKQPLPKNALAGIAYAVVVFGLVGIGVDMLYAFQVQLFGSGSDWATIVKKMLFDQLVWAPLSNYVLVVVLAWREDGFTRSALRRLLSLDYISQRYMPILVAVWCVWVPGVLVIYFMPTALQFPVASLVLSFWILIFKLLRKG
jgi:hypothetical protein